MKIWKKYKEYLLTGEWHVHTNYTDGKNTVFEICEWASRKGIPLVAFTEHVRRQLSYDFDQFLEDIEKARAEFPELIILGGVEAKVLPNCTLDVSDKIIEKVEYPIFAFHSFPRDIELYLKCLKTVIKNEYINAWAHPGLFLKRNGFEVSREDLIEIFKLMRDHEVLLEVNWRYNLPEKYWRVLASKMGVQLVNGGDIHSINDSEGGKP